MNLPEKWFSINDKIRFVITGSLNAGISYIIFVLCVFILSSEHYQVCVALQWVLSSFISYLNQKFLVFGTKGSYVSEYLKCCLGWAVSYVLNAVIIELFVKCLIKNVYVAQFVSLTLVSVITYVLFKYFAFKK